MRPGSRVLEIGCGSGQATLPLAERGYVVTAVEIGPELAAIARRKLAAHPGVEVVVAAFEGWRLPAAPFDAVVSATAFHWIAPDVRVRKAADALRRGGSLAIIETHHVAGGTGQFFVDVQACYERWDPATPPGLRLPAAVDVLMDSHEIDRSGLFGAVAFRRYQWEQAYSAAEYLALLLTYLGHLAVEPTDGSGLLACVDELIGSGYDRRISKRYLTLLLVARKGADKRAAGP